MKFAFPIIATCLLALACEPSPAAEWKTYRNEEFQFALEYPSDWLFEVSQSSGDFDQLAVRLIGPNDEILAVVNFNGDWCTGTDPGLPARIVVNGVAGQHYECGAGAGDSPQQIVRYFPGALGQENYTVLNTDVSDLQTTRRVVNSFSFLD